ncbi:glycosyltransferase [Brucella intermedia]|uniref:glycosyltransferase n=1 Tax=Brucella intermedia TaxID=94625 RepID=UPI002361C760|nr:glycosyltransferase family 2 protein [Brucella intermedia]
MTRRIAVATVTRNRPRMLRQLLLSFRKLNLPTNVHVDFLVVENNSAKTLGEIIEDFSCTVSAQNVVYLLEPELGIARARNRALNYAINQGFDLLTFADDDEVVDPCWLIELLKERDKYNLQLLGSPVRLALPDPALSWWSKMVWETVNENNRRAEKRSIKRWAEGRAADVKIATGSWMGELSFFRRTGLRFNDSLELAGGEDWLLYEEARIKGARTGWTPYAIAYETLPASRLTLKYNYRRDRDHACMVFMERLRKRPSASIVPLLGSLLVRVYKTLIAIAMFPFQPKRALLASVNNIGSCVGFVRGFLGVKSSHYTTTDGY